MSRRRGRRKNQPECTQLAGRDYASDGASLPYGIVQSRRIIPDHLAAVARLIICIIAYYM
jgi:hypothetical protein